MWDVISFTFQVSAMTSKGLCVPIFRGGHPCTYKLLQEEAQHFSSSNMWEEIDGRILKVFLWRYGISIVLTGTVYAYNYLNTFPY
jgi:hypothetical protein